MACRGEVESLAPSELLLDKDYKLPKTSVNYGYTEDEIGDVPIPGRRFLCSINVEI